MIRSLLLIAVVVLVFWAIRHLKNLPTDKRRKTATKFGIYAAIIIVIGLAVTGRLHWLAAAIAAMIPVVQRLIGLGIQVFPFLSRFRQQQQHNQQQTAAKTRMDKEQALQIFGLNEPLDEKQILQRHKELIQKNHPDRGGSDYLAAQINEAREVLLKEIKA